MTDRSDLVRAIHEAQDGPALSRAVAALDNHDRDHAASLAADRELDLGATLAARRLTPVPLHEHHTAATDWLLDAAEPVVSGDYRHAIIAEASVWYSGLDQAVREDPQELAEQARGRARTLASAHGHLAAQAEREFLSVVGYLHQGASGLPQIDQTIDANNQPAPTPYPTEVFPTFGEDQDGFNGVETDNHQSGISSQQAPLIQQVMQQNNSGSGFGTGPERPDLHTTRFDTANSYAEVPLGPPGQIPAAPAATDSAAAASAPNPVAGTGQDAGADRRLAALGFSQPDAFGYQWPTGPEIEPPSHSRCASFHWPDEPCGDRAHTASLAIGYTASLDSARRLAECELIGAGEGLRAFQAARTLGELTAAHNRVAAGWGASDRTAEDSAVLHGFMAVVRPAMADLAHEAAAGLSAEARDFTRKQRQEAEAEGDALPGGKLPVKSKQDLENAEHLRGRVKGVPKSKVNDYMRKKEEEFGKKAASLRGAPNFT